MKIFPVLIAILISYPAFAACPIDGINDACIAEFQALPNISPAQPSLIRRNSSKEFTSTPNAITLDNQDLSGKPLRTFGPTTSDYGYNSSCQFGICRNTGTPKNFEGQNN